MKLRKSMAAAVAGAVMMAGSTMASAQSLTPVVPQLTDDELETIELVREFRACTAEKHEQNQLRLQPYYDELNRIDTEINARAEKIAGKNMAGVNDEIVQDLKAEGVSEDEAAQTLKMLEYYNRLFIADALKETAVYPKRPQMIVPDETCIQEMGIDMKAEAEKLGQMEKKYGRAYIRELIIK